MKKLFRKLREIWHDVYYYKGGAARDRFALTCKEATELTNGHLENASVILKLRYWLHISVCQICKNYFEISNGLRKAIRQLYSSESIKIKQMSRDETAKLNADLLKKHSHH